MIDLIKCEDGNIAETAYEAMKLAEVLFDDKDDDEDDGPLH